MFLDTIGCQQYSLVRHNQARLRKFSIQNIGISNDSYTVVSSCGTLDWTRIETTPSMSGTVMNLSGAGNCNGDFVTLTFVVNHPGSPPPKGNLLSGSVTLGNGSAFLLNAQSIVKVQVQTVGEQSLVRLTISLD